MKNKLKYTSWLAVRGIAIIAIAAVIGLSMTSCKDEESGETFNGQTLISGTPSSNTLKAYGISNSIINNMLDAARAADSDYKGYYEYTLNYMGFMSMKSLVFIWYNKTETKFDSVCDELKSELDLDWMDGLGDYMSGGQSPLPEGTIKASNGSYYDEDDFEDMFTCTATFYLKGYQDIPQNTMSVGFSITTINMGLWD